MARKALVRTDGRGVYVVSDGQRHRPGPLYYPLRSGLRSDAEGVTVGDRVAISPVSSTPVLKVTPDGCETLYWESEDSADRSASCGSDPAWAWVDGRNVPRTDRVGTAMPPAPRIVPVMSSADLDALVAGRTA